MVKQIGDTMAGYLMFILGLIIGCSFGIFIMCCLQINKLNDNSENYK